MNATSFIKYAIATVCITTACFLSSCAPTHAPAPAAIEGAHLVDSASAVQSKSYSPNVQKSRPGLGTGWGSEIKSELNYSNFTRASSKPAGVARIYYNDKEGINAMASNRWKQTTSGMQKAAGGLVSWGVKGNWGSLKNYQSYGKRFVVGKKNQEYSLAIKNNCQSHLEVVLSVDGLDVIGGKPASYKKRGYIISPGDTLTVKGFRTSESAVAAFKFSSVSNSYANLKNGETRNVGVIGMAVFTQKGIDPWKWSRNELNQRGSASPFAEAPNISAR